MTFARILIRMVTMNSVTIEKLPETKEVEGAKRWEEEKGQFVQISYREDIGHLALFEIRKGYFRGSHYHERKEEVFYIVEGLVGAVFRDLATMEQERYILKKGDRIRVKTRCAHIFRALEDSLVVEYSPQYYDKTDAYPVDFGTEP